MCSLKGNMIPVPVTGKINFRTGSGRKAFFDFFFSLILDLPGRRVLLQRSHFFPIACPFENGGDWYWYMFSFP